jgi:hypothetical protein
MQHRAIETISDELLADALARAPNDHYVVWTGGAYKAQAGSLRSEGLKVITEAGTPVKLREVLRRAARIDGHKGYNPDTLRSGIRLHQGAKPAVYLLVERGLDGKFRAVTNIPDPSHGTNAIPAGTILDFDHLR